MDEADVEVLHELRGVGALQRLQRVPQRLDVELVSGRDLSVSGSADRGVDLAAGADKRISDFQVADDAVVTAQEFGSLCHLVVVGQLEELLTQTDGVAVLGHRDGHLLGFHLLGFQVGRLGQLTATATGLRAEVLVAGERDRLTWLFAEFGLVDHDLVVPHHADGLMQNVETVNFQHRCRQSSDLSATRYATPCVRHRILLRAA